MKEGDCADCAGGALWGRGDCAESRALAKHRLRRAGMSAFTMGSFEKVVIIA